MSHPDYYRILQVHPEAEDEVIRAAYRHLMKKYHPDVQNEGAETLQKVQLIGEAYSVLSDPEKRAAYDRAIAGKISEGDFEESLSVYQQTDGDEKIEKLYYPADCGKTKEKYYLVLARPAGSDDLYRLVGFAPRDSSSPRVESGRGSRAQQKRSVPLLFGRRKGHTTPPDFSKFDPSDEELRATFDESRSLEFGDIDWSGKICPVCSSVFTKPDGATSVWILCGRCSHIICSGGIWVGLNETIWHRCPNCRALGHIAATVRVGTKSRFRLNRQLAHSGKNRQGSLEGGAKKHLPPGEDG